MLGELLFILAVVLIPSLWVWLAYNLGRRHGHRLGFYDGANEGYALGIQRSEEFARGKIMELLRDAGIEEDDDGHS